MKIFLSLIFTFLLLYACSNTSKTTVLVNTNTELQAAIDSATPGTTIVLKDGVWSNISIKFKAEGTKDNPITLKAKTPGKVFIEGVSNLSLGGNYLVVDGLYFRNGYSPTKNVIAFKIDNNTLANNSIVTNCVIKDFNKLQRDNDDLWVQFFGRHNELSHTYLAGKTNGGPTVRVDLKGNRSINNYHKIINNHFGPRPRKGGARGETIQLGSSFTSMSPSYTLIANNLFEECNGEVEIISSKTNFNTIKNNVFYKSEGSVVTRHGNYATIDGNYFIGDGVNKQFGGIRLVNTGHWVINNYFYKIIGNNFRSPLAVMNGIPKSPLNRYNQVTDVVVAYNTYIDCASPWQFGVGTNIAQKDVLPKSEIRSARPIRTTVANNVIYNSKGDKTPIIEHDKADGVVFKSNVINNNGMAFNNKDRFVTDDFTVSKINAHVAVAKDISEDISVFNGFEFNSIKTDLFGNERTANTGVGAVVKGAVNAPTLLDYKKYGASWFTAAADNYTPKVIKVANVKDLKDALKNANNTDTIVLEKGTYTLKNPLEIKKKITITSQKNTNVQVVYTGAKNTPAFALHPYGILTLKNIKLSGNTTNYAFASLKENMSNHFGLTVVNCDIANFNYVLKAYKQSFAEQITFKNSQLSNCTNGIELSEEINDRGDYNTEYLTVDKCNFNNIQQNVIDYYRGGYDESTIGGNLLVTNSTFTKCGAKEANNILLNHRGIVNVTINNNSFKDNKVGYVSILWGAKNNSASNNTFSNSSKIKTEENLVQKLMY